MTISTSVGVAAPKRWSKYTTAGILHVNSTMFPLFKNFFNPLLPPITGGKISVKCAIITSFVKIIEERLFLVVISPNRFYLFGVYFLKDFIDFA